MTEKRVSIADFGRGIAATGVVLFHAKVPFSDGWFVLVDYFFVLSGLVLAKSFGRIRTRREWFLFIAKRLVRFLPLVWVVLAAKLALRAVKVYLGLQVTSIPSWTYLLAAGLLLQIVISTSILFVVPLWSLSAELFANALFAGAISKKSSALLLVVLSGYAMLFLGFFVDQPFTDELGPIRYLEGLGRALIGVGLGVVISSSRTTKKSWTLIIVSSFGVLVTLSFPFGHSSVFFAPLVFAVFVRSTLAFESEVQSTAFRRVATRIGELSFGIYVWHWILLWFIESIVSKLDLSGSLRSVTIGFGTLLISSIFAAITFKFVETPAMNYFKKRVQPRFA